MRTTIVAAAMAIALSTVVEARNPARGWYVGLEAGQAEMDGSVTYDFENQFDFDETSPTITVHAGYRFNRFLQLGAFYSDFGSFSTTQAGYQASADLRAAGVIFNLHIPVGEKFGLHGNVSAMNRRLDFSLTEAGQQPLSDYHGGIVTRLGVGLGYQLTPKFDLRYDFGHTRDIGDTLTLFTLVSLDFKANLSTHTLGLRYKF
jgi:opacity protein-like surface antigen